MNTDLKSCFLVAAPTLRCPFFHHTVVLLVDHRDDGSLGFVVNKCADVSFTEVLTKVGIAGSLVGNPTFDENKPVMVGGPVSPNTGWVVFDRAGGNQPDAEGILELENGLGVCANMDMLEEIARGDGPPSYLMMLGLRGMGPRPAGRRNSRGRLDSR